MLVLVVGRLLSNRAIRGSLLLVARKYRDLSDRCLVSVAYSAKVGATVN